MVDILQMDGRPIAGGVPALSCSLGHIQWLGTPIRVYGEMCQYSDPSLDSTYGSMRKSIRWLRRAEDQQRSGLDSATTDVLEGFDAWEGWDAQSLQYPSRGISCRGRRGDCRCISYIHPSPATTARLCASCFTNLSSDPP